MLMRLILTTFWMLNATAALSEIVVFAAASLKEPLDAMANDFGDVVVSYGGSGTLARQIALGAPADVVILANADWMDMLIDGGHARSDSLADLASNQLVMIGAAGADDLLLEVEAISPELVDGRLAVGLTGAVPAGIYAKAALVTLGLWDAVAGRLAEVDNVRAALTLVVRGQSPLGIVYATDARASDQVRIVARFPPGTHPPIRYIGALVSDAPEAAAFLTFVNGPDGRTAFSAAGFLPPVVAE